jgi:hypothetical protein
VLVAELGSGFVVRRNKTSVSVSTRGCRHRRALIYPCIMCHLRCFFSVRVVCCFFVVLFLGFCVCVLCTLCFLRFMQSVFAIHFLPLYHSIYFFVLFLGFCVFCVCVLCTLCFSRFVQSVFVIHFLPLYHSINFF